MNTAEVADAADALAASGYAVALTGAGLSMESGIPTFRGPGGLWSKYGEPSNLSYRAFSQDPQGWWERRLKDEVTPGNPTFDLKSAVDNAAPNPGHLAIAELESMGVIKSVITQNVDGLHAQSGSRNLLEIHGNRNYLRCVGCGHRQLRAAYAVTELPPICADCGGVIKPDTVMFGEPIPAATLDACFEEAQRCDTMLVAGTSGAVSPAARFPLLARERGAQIIEVNPVSTQLTPVAHVVVRGRAGEALPSITDTLRAGVTE